MSARMVPPPSRESTLKGIKGWGGGGQAIADARRKVEGPRSHGTLSPGPSPLQGEGSLA